MRVLEARFHPERKTKPDFVVVGHLLWDDGRRWERPLIQPAATTSSGPLVSELLYLLNMTKPDSFDQLQSLRSEVWSFVDVSDAPARKSFGAVSGSR